MPYYTQYIQHTTDMLLVHFNKSFHVKSLSVHCTFVSIKALNVFNCDRGHVDVKEMCYAGNTGLGFCLKEGIKLLMGESMRRSAVMLPQVNIQPNSQRGCKSACKL